MRLSCVAVTVLLGLVGTAATAQAQEVSSPSTGEDKEANTDGDTIVVQGVRERGVVLGDITPDTVLDEADISSYGASNLTELLAELEAETGSSRGRGGGGPVVLLNGRRISGFREIGRYPPDAVLRVEILPEEAALQYGYKADQRVINVILKKNFSARILEVGFQGSDSGGRLETEYEAGMFFIDGPRRWNLSGEIEFSPILTESERDIIASDPSLPYDSVGNISALDFGAEIDPGLSALAGETVTLSAVPSGLMTPVIDDFLAGANDISETDVSQFRTLRSEEEKIELDASTARDLNEAWGLTLSAGLDIDNSTSLQGLAGVSLDIPEISPFNPFSDDITLYRYAENLGALERQTDKVSGNISLTANRQKMRWVTTITANARYSETDTETDRRADLGSLQDLISGGDFSINPYTVNLGSGFETDFSETKTTNYDATIVTTGPVLDLDAGEVRTTLTGEVSSQSINSETIISDIKEKTDLSRESFIMRGSLDIPLLQEKSEEEWGLGKFAINFNGAVDDLSDFGTLYTYGYGFTWEPRNRLRLIASVTEEDGAPTIAQLGNPRILTENARVYDYTLGETVFVTSATGGNPDLMADHRRVFKLGANWQPFDETNLNFRVDYTDNLIEDPIGSISSASTEIQNALPDLFVRDDDGNLVFVDSTPFNYIESQKRDLRTGFTYSKRLNTTPQRRAGNEQSGRPSSGGRSGPPAGRGPRPSGGGGRMGRGSGGSFRFSVFHTYALEDRILIRDGIEEVDLLGGSAIGSSGGRSEHDITVRANIFYKGLGAWSSWNWKSGTEVLDTTGNSDLDLTFSDIGKFNLNMFVDFNRRENIVQKYPILKNARVRLSVRNVFDSRLNVTDGTGAEPLQYQADLIDPIGRSIGLDLRKSF